MCQKREMPRSKRESDVQVRSLAFSFPLVLFFLFILWWSWRSKILFKEAVKIDTSEWWLFLLSTLYQWFSTCDEYASTHWCATRVFKCVTNMFSKIISRYYELTKLKCNHVSFNTPSGIYGCASTHWCAARVFSCATNMFSIITSRYHEITKLF